MVRNLLWVVGLAYDERFWGFGCACVYNTGCTEDKRHLVLSYTVLDWGGPFPKRTLADIPLDFLTIQRRCVVAAGSGLVDYHVRYENRLVLRMHLANIHLSVFHSSLGTVLVWVFLQPTPLSELKCIYFWLLLCNTYL